MDAAQNGEVTMCKGGFPMSCTFYVPTDVNF